MRTTTMRRLGAAALALALAGCGSSGDNASASGGSETAAATPAANFDPCSLVTKEEVAAITGDEVTKTVRVEDVCKYRGEKAADDGVDLALYLNDGERQINAIRRASGLLEGMGGAVADKGAAGADVAAMLKKSDAAVPKVGDEAAWGMNGTLGVRKGPHYFDVTPPIMHDLGKRPGMPLISGEEKRSISQRVAEKAVARLPG